MIKGKKGVQNSEKRSKNRKKGSKNPENRVKTAPGGVPGGVSKYMVIRAGK